MEIRSDFLVIGSGIAGLSFALKVCKYGSVTIVTKRDCEESSTKYAQGGIASVMAEDDSYELHIKDTLEAGAGLCNEDAVKLLVENGPERVRELMELGAKFSFREDNGDVLALGREGGHSKRRIVHAADFTGAEIERSLIDAVKKNSNIKILENHIAIDLITKGKLDKNITMGSDADVVIGAYVLDKNKGDVISFLSKILFLATGGAGKVYLYTSNPDIATGDGIAMAYRAGAKIANMELIQFHPTCLYHPEAKSFLISEAVRGEGGILRLKDGKT